MKKRNVFLLFHGNIAKAALDGCDFANVNVVGGSMPSSWHDQFKTMFNLHKNQIHSCDSKDINSLFEIIKTLNIDLLFSVQYPWILKEKHLSAVNGNVFNLHNASLPAYRGHNSLTYEILNNDEYHVMTIHKMATAVDRGSVYLEKKIKIQQNETALSLHRKCVSHSVELCQDFLNLYIRNELKEIRSCNEGGQYYSKRDIESLRHAPSNSSFEHLEKLSRAMFFPPYEPPFILVDEKKIYLLPQTAYDN